MVAAGSTGCCPPGSERRPSASSSGKRVTLFPPQPKTKAHMILQPASNCKFGGYTWEVDREGTKEPCSRPHYWQEFLQDPPHPSRSEVRHSWGCSLGGMTETPSLPCGILWGVQEAALTGGLLTRTPSHYPGPQHLCHLPPHPRPGRGKDGAWWAGAGPEEGARDSVTGRAGQAGLAGAGGATATNCPPACRRRVGAWVGFRFRRGCDCEARKLRGKFRLKHKQNPGPRCAWRCLQSSLGAGDWAGGPAEQFTPTHTSVTSGTSIPPRRKEPEPGDFVSSPNGHCSYESVPSSSEAFPGLRPVLGVRPG